MNEVNEVEAGYETGLVRIENRAEHFRSMIERCEENIRAYRRELAQADRVMAALDAAEHGTLSLCPDCEGLGFVEADDPPHHRGCRYCKGVGTVPA